MIDKKQVEKSHYEFIRYMDKGRWCSLWHQLDEVIGLNPESVLEVGPGPGVFKHVSSLFGINVKTIDIDPELGPDYVGSVTALPFPNDMFDVVCAFQMLEHLPYDVSLKAFSEMVRTSRYYVVISLPDTKPMLRYQLHFPKIGVHNFLVPRPKIQAAEHKFDGQHYWEVNKRGYSLSKIISDFTEMAQLIKTYRVYENISHRFFIFKC